MSSTKSHSVPTPESVHDAWLSQRAELERDLFDGWAIAVHSIPTPAVTQTVPVVAKAEPVEAALKSADADSIGHKPATGGLATETLRHQEWLQQSNAAAVRSRVDHQLLADASLSQQREAFVQDLTRQRAAFEQELSDREAAWVTQREQEWSALRISKEVHEVAEQRLKDALSTQRVSEREELMQWRRQAENELAEARRNFEQERLQEHQEFARQRESELTRLRREREELETRVRHAQSELAHARQRQEDELRQARDVQTAQLRSERAELDKLRDTWLEKFRREQVVLENGMQFFGQHLSRVSEELRMAQRGLQAVSESATEAHPTALFVAAGSVAAKVVAEVAVEVAVEVEAEASLPTLLSLDEIRQRLNELKQPQRAAA